MSVPMWFRRKLYVGDYGSDVDTIRRKLLLHPGVYDETLSQVLKGICLRAGLEYLGEVDENVALIIGESAANEAALLPQWYEDHDDATLRRVLGVGEDEPLVPAVQRWQGSHGFPPTGVIDEHQARLLGD